MRFRVLGPVEVTGETGPISLGGRKRRVVLAHLIVRANELVTADALIDLVWGDEPPDAARSTLFTYISHLRKALGAERIEGRTPGYVLHVGPDELDAARFELLLQEARDSNGRSDAAGHVLREALALWRGPAYADLAAEEPLAGEIARLEELRLEATEGRLAADLDAGRHGEVIGELGFLTHRLPLRERLWEHLMLALYRSGRPADALVAYQRARDVLAAELGVDPSPDLQRLYERILRQDPDLDLQGEPLRGYRLLERIGEGAFGVVHRALQPQVGREVAVKAIHPELANHPDFVRRFEREAQIVARLEHPHIVPLYDYWREPDAAYLVMRFLRGGSLAELIDDGPLEPLLVAKILDQIAAALSAAHRQGVVHRDVKPGNVLLDEDGNAYLTDFGVALDEGAPEKTMGTMMRGTPAYISPEQIRLEPATPQSDIYALGIVLYEMLAGSYPFAETSMTALLDRHLHDALPSIRDVRTDLPPAVGSAIARATAKDGGDRFSDALEVAAAFRAALEGSVTVREPAVEIRNPYKGLRAFLEADAGDFFGREKLTDRLVRRLRQHDLDSRFLALVGPSGSGKSSVVRAGLVPALRRGAVPGSERWYVVDMHPGAHPLRELESALLAIAVDPPPSLLEELERDELGLVRAAARILPDPGSELVVVLDQLEEIFTLVEDEDERSHMLASIRASAQEPDSRVRVITTLRADFYDQPLSVPGFGDLLAARNEAITPMSLEELELAIAAPADRAGLVVEPMLLAAMIADVADRPGALPLLQYALTELAERAEGGVLTVGAYHDIGRVSGALARRAEQLFEAMNETGRIACRQLFLRLVTLGEGSEDTRRRVRRSEVLPLADTQSMEGVIESYGRHRLLSFDRDPSSREPTVEIAHEALLGAWARLRGWIDEARDDIRTQRRLSAAAGEWEAGGRDLSFLLRGARLDQATAWTETTTLAISDDDRGYLDASAQQRDAEIAAQRAAEERERGLERRSVRRLRGLVAIGVAAALVASSLSVIAVGQRGTAERQGRIATARELASAAVANLEVDPQRSVLLALAAVDVTGAGDEILPEVEEALRRSLAAHREVLTFQHLPSSSFAISPDGNHIVTRGPQDDGGAEPGFVVHDLRTGAPLRDFALPPEIADEGLTHFTYSPDGTRIAALTYDSTVIVLETRSWSREWTVNLDREISAAGDLQFSPDGRLLAAVGVDGIVSIVDASSGQELQRMREPGGGLLGVAFSRDGTRVGATPNFGSGPIPIWDVRTGRRVLELGDVFAGAFGIAFSPDGDRIATSGPGDVRIWNARTGDEVRTLEGHNGEVWGVTYSPDGLLIASTADDGIRVWDSSDGTELMALHGHTGTVWSSRFTPDGEGLVTGGADGTVRVWDVSASGSRELRTIGDPTWSVDDVEYSPDGTRLLTLGWPAVHQWDAHTGRPVSAAWMDGWGGAVYSPDGTRFATQGRPFVGEAEPGGELGEMDLDEEGYIGSVAYSPDGTSVAGGLSAELKPGLVYIWDVQTGARIQMLGEEGNRYDHVRGVAFSPDGALLAGLPHSGNVHIWDLASGEEIRSWDTGTENGDGIAFSPDGVFLATSGADGAALWESASGRLVARLRGHAGDVPDVAFSSDGTMVATAGEDGTARVWSVPTGRQVHTLFGHTSGVTGVAFSPDGQTLATSSADGTIRQYVLGIDELIEIATSRLTRSLSVSECQRYLHVSPCPAGLPSPLPVDAPSGTTDGPEGAFRVTIVPTDLRGQFTDREIDRTIGDYTLSMFDGTWRLHQDWPNGRTFDTSGSYTVSGDTITFIDLQDPRCFGASWSAEWALEGISLSFVDTGADPARGCGGELPPPWVLSRIRNGEEWPTAVFGSNDWTRIV